MYKILVKKWWERTEQFYGSIYLSLILSYNSLINSNTFYEYAKLSLKYPRIITSQLEGLCQVEILKKPNRALVLCYSCADQHSLFYSLYKAIHFKRYQLHYIPCFFHCSSNSSILDLSIKDKPSTSLVLTS